MCKILLNCHPRETRAAEEAAAAVEEATGEAETEGAAEEAFLEALRAGEEAAVASSAASRAVAASLEDLATKGRYTYDVCRRLAGDGRLCEFRAVYQ